MSNGDESGDETASASVPLLPLSIKTPFLVATSQKTSLETDGRKERDEHHEAHKGHPFLSFLRLIDFHGIKIFPLPAVSSWSIRKDIGKGASYSVDEATVPQWNHLYIPYREAILFDQKGEPFFTDHTGLRWSNKTQVAYKLPRQATRPDFPQGGGTQDIIADLSTEIRILCHLPIQKHPNIVRLLAVALVNQEDMSIHYSRNEQMDRHEFCWPVAVVERSEEGSIDQLLHVRRIRAVTTSLRAKFRLFVDTLRALNFLHACSIFHGDIKPGNILVYKSSEGTDENWTAKVCDFSRSKLNIDQSVEVFSARSVIGTEEYCPPELIPQKAEVAPAALKSIDVWCLGMLLWYILSDGKGFATFLGSEEIILDGEHLQILKTNGRIRGEAISYCERVLLNERQSQPQLVNAVLDALDGSLQHNPNDRRCSEALLRRVPNQFNLASSPLDPEPLVPEQSLPPFDITRVYYDLIPFPRLATQVFQELKDLSNGPNTEIIADLCDPVIQLGLCQIVGFGVEKSPGKAVEYFTKAAQKEKGRKMKSALPRIATALDVQIDEETSRLFQEWNQHAPILKQTISMTDLSEPEVIKAVKFHDLDQLASVLHKGAAPMDQGTCGETALHQSVLAVRNGRHMANVLLDRQADPYDPKKRPRQPVPRFEDDFACNYMPPDTSAMDWAIIEDNRSLVQLFLEQSGIPEEPEQLIRTACQYASTDCLRYLLGKLSGQPTKVFIDHYSMLYYALRPDIFSRLLRSVRQPVQHRENVAMSLHQRQLEVVEILLEAGVCKDMTNKFENRFGFTALHLLAAFGEPDLLASLLEKPEFADMINQRAGSELSYVTPLRDAMSRSCRESFHLLLNHGAQTLDIAFEMHAIHFCAQIGGDIGMEFARTLIHRDPSSVNVKTRLARSDEYDPAKLEFFQHGPRNATALHWGAFCNNVDFMKLLLSERASLLEPELNSLTALGTAVASRSIRAVRQLRYEHSENRLPLQAWCTLGLHPFADWLPVGEGSLQPSTALHFLLRPGNWSPPSVELEQFVWQSARHFRGLYRGYVFGAADLPFSRASLLIAEILLEKHKHVVRFRTNVIHSLIYKTECQQDLVEAIQWGNHKVIRKILESDISQSLSNGALRDLVQFAVDQLMYNAQHPASDEVRNQILEELYKREQKTYEQLKKNRELSSNSLRPLWMLYYGLFEDIRAKQFWGIISWQKANRHLWWRPCVTEFYSNDHRFALVNLAITWCLTIPLLVFYHKLSVADPRGYWHYLSSDAKLRTALVGSHFLLFQNSINNVVRIHSNTILLRTSRLWRPRYPQSPLNWSTITRPVRDFALSVGVAALGIAVTYMFWMLPASPFFVPSPLVNIGGSGKEVFEEALKWDKTWAKAHEAYWTAHPPNEAVIRYVDALKGLSYTLAVLFGISTLVRAFSILQTVRALLIQKRSHYPFDPNSRELPYSDY